MSLTCMQSLKFFETLAPPPVARTSRHLNAFQTISHEKRPEMNEHNEYTEIESAHSVAAQFIKRPKI